MDPHLVLIDGELNGNWHLVPAPVLDDVVRAVQGGFGSEPHRDCVPLLLGVEVPEDGSQAPFGIAGDLPEAVVVEMVADIGELRGSHYGGTVASDWYVTTTFYEKGGNRSDIDPRRYVGNNMEGCQTFMTFLL